MSKKFIGFAPLLAILAFAVVPAGAQAATQHWYVGGSILPPSPPGEGANVVTWGTLTTNSSVINALVCKNTFTLHVENPELGGAGKAQVEGFNAYHCTNAICQGAGKKIEVVPLGLKTSTVYGTWPVETTELGTEPAAEIKNIEFEAICPGVFAAGLGGVLTVNVKNGFNFAVPTKFEFKGATSGTLTGGTATATVTGKVKVIGYEAQELTEEKP